MDTASDAVPLQWNQKYEFLLSASFKEERDARNAAAATENFGTTTTVNPPSLDHSNWGVYWSITAKPRRFFINRLKRRIEAEAARHGAIGASVNLMVVAGTIKFQGSA